MNIKYTVNNYPKHLRDNNCIKKPMGTPRMASNRDFSESGQRFYGKATPSTHHEAYDIRENRIANI